MKRTISPIALLFIAVSAIVGSGWLFSSYYSAQLAGPAALLAWVFSGIGVIIVGFVFGEMCSMLPITAVSARAPQFTHGRAVGFLFSWLTWLSYVALAPIEVQAVIQYLAFYFPELTHQTGALTESGYVLATVLMFIISAINVYSLKWLMRGNNLLTVIKILIPVILSLVIMLVFFTPEHLFHPQGSVFAPFGFHGVLAAISSGGIVFAFNGFKQAAELGGEARNPKIALPFAIIGSIFICFVIFSLLQIALLVSLTPDNLATGWSSLNLPSKVSPFATIIHQNKLTFLFPILYFGAILAPFAAGLICANTASRTLYGVSKNGYLPAIFQKLNKHGNPVAAISINFLVSMLIFAPLPGWQKMATFLSSLMAVSYIVGPICLLALRKQIPKHGHPFKLPFSNLWSCIAFYICTLLIYWTGWDIIYKLIIMIALGTLILFIFKIRNKKRSLHLFSALWLLVYFIGMAIISYLGNFGGGKNIIPFGVDFFVLAIFSIIILWFAYKTKLPSEETQAFVNELKVEME